jgi:hypothetical protein
VSEDFTIHGNPDPDLHFHILGSEHIYFLLFHVLSQHLHPTHQCDLVYFLYFIPPLQLVNSWCHENNVEPYLWSNTIVNIVLLMKERINFRLLIVSLDNRIWKFDGGPCAGIILGYIEFPF